MDTSDIIQLIIAVATSVGVIGALIGVILTNKSSVRAIALAEKERTATYRGTLYSKQLDTYNEVLDHVTSARNSLAKAELSMRYGLRWTTKVSDLLVNKPLKSEEDQAKDDQQALREIIDQTNNNLEAILYKRQVWAGILPDKILEAVNQFVVEYTVLFEKVLNIRYNDSDIPHDRLTGAYDQVVMAIRDELQIEALRQQTLDAIGQDVRQQASAAKSQNIVGNPTNPRR